MFSPRTDAAEVDKTDFDTQDDTKRILRQAESDSFCRMWECCNHTDDIYRNFIETQISTDCVLVMTILLTSSLGLLLLVRAGHLVNSETSTSTTTSLIHVFRMIQDLMVIVLSWMTCHLKRARKYDNRDWIVDNFDTWASHIQAAQAILWSTLVGTVILHEASQVHCHKESFAHNHGWICDSEQDTGRLPLLSVALTLLVPATIFTVLPDTKIWALLVSFAISSTSFAATSLFSSSVETIPAACLYLICSVLIMYETQRQKVALYLVADRLHTILTDTQRTAKKTHATEMRHMIANVAHDLKTPLSSFVSGVDMIIHIANDCRQVCERVAIATAADVHQILGHIDEIANCTGDINSTNAFMLMTINRCIDYTKASQGIKLVPKLETIDLQDTINLPLRVMRDLKAAVHIVIAPLSPDICSHVITDKQWLQENLLCLLSNAIKYSGRGQVDVSVGIVDSTMLLQETEVNVCNSEKDVFSDVNVRTSTTLSRSGSSAADGQLVRRKGSAVRPRSDTMTSTVLDCKDMQTFSSSDSSNVSPNRTPRSWRESTTPSQFLKVEVQDTGIGLSDEAKKNLFKPFKQAQRMAGGTGLGLFSLTKRMEALGGNCGVTDRRDQQHGCLFWFTVPYRPDTESAANAVEATAASVHHSIAANAMNLSHDEPPALVTASTSTTAQLSNDSCEVSSLSTSEFKPLRILLVDDSLSILKMTKMALKRDKHEVVTADNGLQALELMTKEYLSNKVGQFTPPFDAVLMDVNMPVMDGLESVRRIREFENNLPRGSQQPFASLLSASSSNESVTTTSATAAATAATPLVLKVPHQFIIGVTANSDQQTLEDSKCVGMDAFLPKPFRVSMLYEAMQEYNMQKYT